MEPIILPRISDQKPLVSIVSITYNHELYIRDCLEGFLMQKARFPIEIIVHDDASTDHTADILREYYKKKPDLFHIILEKDNQFSQGKDVLIPLYEQAQGKYIAVCEGDDYWIDPLKLQKQFDFMESHPEYSGCIHNFFVNYCQREITKKRNNYYKMHKIINLPNAIRNGTKDIHLCTAFFSKKAISDIWSIKNNCPVGDYPLQICLAKHGNIYYIDNTMSVYRKGSAGSWSSKNTILQIQLDHANRMIDWLQSIRPIVKDNESVDIAIGAYLYFKAKKQKKRINTHGSKEIRKYLSEQSITKKIYILFYNFWHYTRLLERLVTI